MLSKFASHWTDIAALALFVASFCLVVRFGWRFEHQKEQQNAD